MRRSICAGGLLLGGCIITTPVSTPPTLVATQVAAEKVARDFDGDGFVDGEDRCPVAVGVAPHGCPDPDSDSDGYVDSKDACRDEAGVEPDGCPIRDSDGDGILDPNDGCPLKEETKNGLIDEDGCPDQVPADLAAITGTIRGIYFHIDKDTIKPKSRPVLNHCVAVLARYPEVRIEVSGHIDSTGNPYSQRSQLSGRRANSVKRYLVEHGIADSRIETRGAGPDEPIDTNKTAVGRAKNRRIEFTLLVQ